MLSNCTDAMRCFNELCVNMIADGTVMAYCVDFIRSQFVKMIYTEYWYNLTVLLRWQYWIFCHRRRKNDKIISSQTQAHAILCACVSVVYIYECMCVWMWFNRKFRLVYCWNSIMNVSSPFGARRIKTDLRPSDTFITRKTDSKSNMCVTISDVL